MSRRRPWRALAVAVDPASPTGHHIVGRVAACTQQALQPWVDRRRAEGCAVSVLEVLSLTEVTVTPAASREPAPVA